MINTLIILLSRRLYTPEVVAQMLPIFRGLPVASPGFCRQANVQLTGRVLASSYKPATAGISLRVD